MWEGGAKIIYYLKKRLEISASHRLELPYKSKCNSPHGHNWIITVYCRSEVLDENGMIIDFTIIKNVINDGIDHKNLNDIIPENPTAENIGKWVIKQIPYCYKVTVQESEGNEVTIEI